MFRRLAGISVNIQCLAALFNRPFEKDKMC